MRERITGQSAGVYFGLFESGAALADSYRSTDQNSSRRTYKTNSDIHSLFLRNCKSCGVPYTSVLNYFLKNFNSSCACYRELSQNIVSHEHFYASINKRELGKDSLVYDSNDTMSTFFRQYGDIFRREDGSVIEIFPDTARGSSCGASESHHYRLIDSIEIEFRENCDNLGIPYSYVFNFFMARYNEAFLCYERLRYLEDASHKFIASVCWGISGNEQWVYSGAETTDNKD